MVEPLFFSVIIPFFNRKKYLGKAIESVLNQSYADWELILVDDGSTDDSLRIANSFADSRVKVISNSSNSGNAVARNTGWKSANYPWVAYLDSDDWYEPNYLDRMAQAIRSNPNSGFFWTGVRFVREGANMQKEEFWKPLKALPSDTFFDQLRIGTNAGVCFSKSVLEELAGFESRLRASVDREFLLRISPKHEGRGVDFIGVNCLIGMHESVRKSYAHQAEAYDFLIERYKIQIEKNSKRKTWWYHKAMWLSLYCGNRKRAKNYLGLAGYPAKSLFLFLIFIFLPNALARKIHKSMAC